MRTRRLVRIWDERHREEWSERGIGPSADAYAYVVAEQRTGERKSLSLDIGLGSRSLPGDPGQGRRGDKENRKLIREQIDAILEDAAISESIQESRAEAARDEADDQWEPRP